MPSCGASPELNATGVIITVHLNPIESPITTHILLHFLSSTKSKQNLRMTIFKKLNVWKDIMPQCEYPSELFLRLTQKHVLIFFK